MKTLLIILVLLTACTATAPKVDYSLPIAPCDGLGLKPECGGLGLKVPQ